MAETHAETHAETSDSGSHARRRVADPRVWPCTWIHMARRRYFRLGLSPWHISITRLAARVMTDQSPVTFGAPGWQY